MGLGVDVVDNRRDRCRHPIPLRRQEGFAQVELCSEERAGKAKDGDE
jgi:hypothetical protein